MYDCIRSRCGLGAKRTSGTLEQAVFFFGLQDELFAWTTGSHDTLFGKETTETTFIPRIEGRVAQILKRLLGTRVLILSPARSRIPVGFDKILKLSFRV